MQQLYYILLFCVSASECVIGYYLLFHTILEWGSLTLLDKSAVLMGVVLPSLLLTINRRLTFFSDLIFLLVVIFFGLIVYLIKKNDFWFVFSYIWLYYTLVALMDMCVAFLSMMIFEQHFAELVYLHASSLWQIILYIISRLVTLAVVLCIVKSRWKIDGEFTLNFFAASVILFFILKRYQIRMSKMVLGESDLDGVNNGFSLLVIVLVIAEIMILNLKNQIVYKEKTFLEQNEQMIKQNYKLQQQNDEINHQLVHDIKHHLLLLRKLADEQDVSRIKMYLDEIEKEYTETENRVWTSNRFLDFILNQKKQKAEDKEIRMTIDSEVIPVWNLTENEMSVVFGNLLDNAIEACEKIRSVDKWIKVYIKKRSGIIIIGIGNSIEQQPVILQNKFISDKVNIQRHGYGVKSARRIVERQDGCMEWRVLKHEFYINISFFDSDRWKEGERCANRKL
jgi:signal transduction histidine kinase